MFGSILVFVSTVDRWKEDQTNCIVRFPKCTKETFISLGRARCERFVPVPKLISKHLPHNGEDGFNQTNSFGVKQSFNKRGFRLNYRRHYKTHQFMESTL